MDRSTYYGNVQRGTVRSHGTWTHIMSDIFVGMTKFICPISACFEFLIATILCFFLDGNIIAISGVDSGQNNHWTPAIIWSFPQFRESQFRKSQVSLRWWSIELQALRTGIGSCVGSAQDRIDEPFFPFWCYFDTIKSWLHRQGTRLGSERCFHANVDGQCRRAGGPAAGAAAGPWNSAPS